MTPLIRLSLLFLLLITTTHAAVVRVEEISRKDLGPTGYEQIVGKLHYEIDPQRPCNAIIADLDLAPVNAGGRVSFSADLRILKPKDEAKSNGAAWMEIPNRGGKASLSKWVIDHGFTVVNVGWEFDVPLKKDMLRLEVPRARNKDGSAIRGVVSAILTLDKVTPEKEVTDLAEYPPVDIDGPESRLILRDQAAFPAGGELPREKWSFKDGHLRVEGGLQPGVTYELFYLAESPPVAGLGYAAIRDAAAWLKHDATSLAKVKHTYAFGSSQCGRFLRDFLYLGFNTDEQDRAVLDGVIPHVAGAGRLVLNQRWSTPRAISGYYTASYPFADKALPDAISGQTEGILDNPRVKHLPKIFAINMAAEYWGAGRVGALTHTTPDGKQDVTLPENVRSYFFASTSHGPAAFPPTSQVKGSPMANPVNTSASVVALRLALHRWVTEGIEPPPSVYPKLSDGTLVNISEVKFPKVPGMAAPNAVSAGGRIANPQLPDGAGPGAPLPLPVPQADADGNDLGGIRMPDVAVPLATATGWVFRPAEYGSPQDFYLLRGAWVPFAKTKAQREANNDPRPSLEERYTSKEDFMAQVKAATEQLIQQRLLSPNDLEPQLKQAGQRWDWIMGVGFTTSPHEFHKVLILGNSITKHGPKADIDWSGNWGMAASAESKDYVHLVTQGILRRQSSVPEVLVKNIADFERAYDGYDIAGKLKEAIEFEADLIILAIGENVPGLKTAEDTAKLQEAVTKLLTLLKGGRSPTIVVRSCFWANAAKDEALRKACDAVKGIPVDISALSKDESHYARSERPYKHAGVANHPGDKGMAAIADAIVKALPK